MALADNLISYWSLDEASGNATDSHGSNTLTDLNTVTSAVGKIGNARDFEADNSEALTSTDNASLSTGDIDWTIAAWVQIESLTTRCVFGKGDGAGPSTDEYVLRTVASKFRWSVSRASAYTDLTASTFGTVTTGTWYFVVAWHDSAANQIGISVNAGTADTASHSTGPNDTAKGFAIGRYGELSAQYWDGLIDEVGFWKRVLTGAERTELYNGGAGRDYAYVSGGAAGHPAMRRLGLVGRCRPVEIGREGTSIF